MEIRKRVGRILEGLTQGIYEKDEVIRLSFLSAIAGESIFLLGPPGVAKSLIARRLKHAFSEGKSFEYLMNKFSTPDEIFGPVSIKKLKDEDRYERRVQNYLPGANVVFLDEIWKAGPSIQNALLTILNEKVYRNGDQEIKVDIKSIVSASNELPPQGESLEPLWDRFLLRYLITEIKDKGNFLTMITNTDDVYEEHIDEADKITHEELTDWNGKIDAVEVPNEVLNCIQVIKHKLDEHDTKHQPKFNAFDRRWKKIIRLMRTSAFLNGRQKIDLMDCFLLVHCLWNVPEQIEILQKIVAETIRKHGYSLALNLNGLKREISELDEEVKRETKIAYQKVTEEPDLIKDKYYEVLNIGQLYDGKYIRYNEYERLRMDEHATIGLYDDAESLTFKIKAKRSAKDNHLDVFHASKYTTLELRTLKNETTDFVYKKPHPLVQESWDNKIETLTKYITEVNRKLEEESPQELTQLKENLFVQRGLSQIVEANMNDAVGTIRAESLKVEKIAHYYQSL